MALTTDDIFQAAFDLSREDRRELVERLLATLDDNQREQIERAWIEEAKQRLQDYREGRMQGHPAAEVFESLRTQSPQ